MQRLPTSRRGGDGGVSPWRHWEELEDQMQRLLQTMSGAPAPDVSGWAPRVDFAEEDDRFVLTTELPGVEPEDVEIEVSGDVISIHGEKQATHEYEQDRFHVAERRYGTFHREVTLPPSADPENVEAGFHQGVLTVKVGKRAESRGRRIPVRPN